MKPEISEIIKLVKYIILTTVVRLKDFIAVLRLCKTSYAELLKSGEIESKAVGEKVFVRLKANVCGDIMIFIGPNNEKEFTGNDVMQLIRNDNLIETQKEIALKTLLQKHEALTVLPNLFSLLVNIAVITITVLLTLNGINEINNRNFDPYLLKDLWPWIFPVLTILFRKRIGYGIISFFFK